MKILYIQPRFHTNQHPIVTALQDEGHTVQMLTQYRYISENYSTLSPEVLGYSRFYEIFESIWMVIRGEVNRTHRINFGIPPLLLLYQRISKFGPDLVVLRDYSMYSLFSMVSARFCGSNVLIYDQKPKYGASYGRRMRIFSQLYRQLWGRDMVRMTPVQGDTTRTADANAFYVPFIQTPSEEVDNRSYVQDDAIKILSIGKYGSERKNHTLLLDSVNELLDEYNLSVTFIGHLDRDSTENFTRINRRVRELGLEDVVEIRTNVPYDEVQQAYLNHDLFVLPSRGEPAAVSHLEAMAHGLPVICSDSNGTRYYLEENTNGHIFRTDSVDDLCKKIEDIISSPSRIEVMGKASLQIVREQHSSEVYIEGLMNAAAKAGTNVNYD